MLKIKLARFGKKHQAHYRIVVNEARDKRDGSYVALVGNYAPGLNPKELVIDVKAYDQWVAKGAQPTETVAALYERFKSGNPFPAKKAKLSKKAKAKLAAEKEAKNAPKEEAPKSEAAQEAPAEEKAEEVAPEAEAPVEEKAETEEAKSEEKAE
jgi:small subunit ribosomal protein S16